MNNNDIYNKRVDNLESQLFTKLKLWYKREEKWWCCYQKLIIVVFSMELKCV